MDYNVEDYKSIKEMADKILEEKLEVTYNKALKFIKKSILKSAKKGYHKDEFVVENELNRLACPRLKTTLESWGYQVEYGHDYFNVYWVK